MAATILRGPAALAALLAAAGCAGIPDNFREPDVTLDHVVVQGVGVRGGTLDLVVNVYNPNSFALRGTELRVGFEVEGDHVGDIRYDEDFQVQEGDTTTVTLPLAFEWTGVGSAFRSALEYGDIPYTMNGEVTVETPIGSRSVPFEREGRVPVSQAAEIPGR